MARSRVPADPNTPPELRRFFDDLARQGDALLARIAETEEALEEFEYASEAEAQAGSVTDKLMSPRRTYDSILALTPFLKMLHVQDRKTDGTDGGTFTQGAWQTRDLNITVSNTISGASLSANNITLPAGTYYIDASACAFAVQRHKLRFYNTTDSSVVFYGPNEFCTTSNDASRATVRGRFTIADQKMFELQHRCGTTSGTNGFGFACTFGGNEIYADVMIWKLTE